MVDNELQLLCIIPFESTLKHLYNTDKDALEEFMRVLIQLDEVNVRHIIYTTTSEIPEITAVLEEYGLSKYFIPEEDIFEIQKMTWLPSDDPKLFFINWVINHHNRTRPNRFIDLKQVKERVLVLDEDPKLLGDAKSYTAPIQIEANLTYISLLDNIYKTLSFVSKDSKQQQANALRRLAKMQDTQFVDDQEMMSLNYQTRSANISSNLTDGMYNFITKMKIYLSIVVFFKQYEANTKKNILKNIKEGLSLIIRELKRSDEIISELLIELQAMQPLAFMGDSADLNQWQKLSYDLCSCIREFFEKKLNKALSINELNSNLTLSYELQIALCKKELDDLEIGLLDLYLNDLSQHSHHAQKNANNRFYWLVIDGDARKKQEAIKTGMKLYEPLLREQINAEKKFLEKNRYSLDQLQIHYKKKSDDVEANKQDIYYRMGNRDSELRTERDHTYTASKKLTQQALFESTVMPMPARDQSSTSAHGAYYASPIRYSTLRINVNGVNNGLKNDIAFAQKVTEVIPEKKADLFELCRAGDIIKFANEVYTQLSVAYDDDDISLLLKIQFNYSAGCSFLLKGDSAGTYPDRDGNAYCVCLSPAIPFVAGKQNICMYLDKHSSKQMPGKKDILDEIELLLKKQPNNHIKILFPYQVMQQAKLYWFVGEIRLHKKGSDYEIELITINPHGLGKFEDETFNALCNSLTAGIKKIDSSARTTFKNKETNFSPALKKAESFSSGPVVIEIIANSIKDNKSVLDQAVPLNVKEIRRRHVNTLKTTFKEDDNRLIKFLSRHLDIDQINMPRKTLLETSCQHGHVAIVGFLIDEMSVNVNFSLSGYHPIFSGLRGLKMYPIRINLVRYLLQGTTDLNHGSNHSAILRNVVDTEGRPVLHVAVSHGVDRSVETLVRWGMEHPGTINLYAKNKKNRTALHEAMCTSKYGKLHGVIRVLLEYGLGQTKAALETLHLDKDLLQETLKFIISYFEEQLKQVQKISAAVNQTPKLQRVRSNSFSELPIFQRNRSGSLIGVFANLISPRINYEWKSKVSQYCAENKISNLPMSSTELNTIDEQGFAPIHVVCICGKLELLEHLIKLKVNLNLGTQDVVKRKLEGKDETPELINTTKLTPLHLAVLCQRRYPEFVSKLLAQGVQVTQDSNQSTALHYAACRDSKFLELILAQLEKINSLEIANLRDKDGNTALTKALLTGDKTLIIPFINVGIWPSQTDLMYIQAEINQRENKVEIKQSLFEIFEILKNRYQNQLNLLQQSAPITANLKPLIK